MAQLNFGGVIEEVMTREEFPLEKAREILKNETIAVLGYGVQGPGQACNLRDNGFNVIVGQRQGKTYEKAVADGWVPGETLRAYQCPTCGAELITEKTTAATACPYCGNPTVVPGQLTGSLKPDISAITFPVSASFITVPCGTFKIRSAPFLP